jgi:hypothetical protein
LGDKANKSGDTFTGPVDIRKPSEWGQIQMRTPSGFYRAVETSDNCMRLDVRDADSTADRTYLDLISKVGQPDVGGRLMMRAVEGNQTQAYKIWGQHNLPIESGSWTPTLYGYTTAGSPAYATKSGSYCRVGKMVMAAFRIDLSSIGGMGGWLHVSGMPFTPGADFTCGLRVFNSNMPSGQYAHALRIWSGGCQLFKIKATTGSDVLSSADISDNTAFVGAMTYFTA